MSPPDDTTRSDAARSFSRLIDLMHRLRAPGGCPWDAEQSHDSIKLYAVEEAFEVVEAIERGSDDELRDELGDLLLQVVFHAEMASERDAFAIDDVIAALSEKLVRRHPHVFGDVRVDSAAEVVTNWSRIKAEEKARASGSPSSAVEGVPRGLPALLRAHRIGEKAGRAGFDWTNWRGVREKLDEELRELDDALAAGDDAAVADEIGDMLLTLASLARHRGVNSEDLLRRAIERFERRVRGVEADLGERGVALAEASAAEIDAAWQRAKRALSAGTRRS